MRPTFLPTELYDSLLETDSKNRADRAIQGLGWQSKLDDALDGLKRTYEREWKPAPVILSDRPDAMQIRAQQQQQSVTVQPAMIPSGPPPTPETPSLPAFSADEFIHENGTSTYRPAAAASGAPSAMPTGGSVGSAQPASGGKSPEGQARVYQAARGAGLDDEGARILVAVTETEGGWGGAVGDQGQSHGIYQFHAGGQMPGFRAWLQQNGVQGDPYQLAYDPDIATRYAASGYLGRTIAEGRAKGLSGAELATYVQQHGQVSVDPWKTGQNYTRLYGGGGQAVPSVPRHPDMQVQPLTPADAQRMTPEPIPLAPNTPLQPGDIQRLPEQPSVGAQPAEPMPRDGRDWVYVRHNGLGTVQWGLRQYVDQYPTEYTVLHDPRRQSSMNAAPGGASGLLMRQSIEPSDAMPEGAGVERDPRRFIPERNLTPLGPAMTGRDWLDDDQYQTARPNREPYSFPSGDGGIEQPVRPWTPPGTRNQAVPGNVVEYTEAPEPQPYGPFDPHERNRPVPGWVDEEGGQTKYPNILGQRGVPPTVAVRWRQRVGTEMTPEDVQQLRMLGVM